MKKNLKTENGNLKRVLVDIDNIAVMAMKSYLRTCLNGGMPLELAKQVEDAVEDAARLNYFEYFTALEYNKLNGKQNETE